MNITESIRLSFESLKSNKLRSFLTMLGIIIGIASIIAIVSTIKGTSEQIKEDLIGAGSNTVKIYLYDGDNQYDAEYGNSSKTPILTDDVKEEVKDYLNKVKEEYPNATHYCYAYIIDNDTKFSDDGEPSKTAGLPIFTQLEGNNLNYALIIVVRYFGGIKLGTGLLTRTYSKVAKEVITKDNIIELTKGYNITIIFDYEDIKNIDYLLKDSQILKKDFQDNITYNVNVNEETFNKLQNYNIKINKDIYIQK